MLLVAILAGLAAVIGAAVAASRGDRLLAVGLILAAVVLYVVVVDVIVPGTN